MARTEESGFEAVFRGLSLDRLRSFAEVVDAGGFAKAAPGDPSRQSQLSRQVREVERALGVPLLRRAGRTVVATEAGGRLRVAIGELSRGLSAAKGLREGSVAITLSAGDSALRWLVLPALAASRSAPLVQTSLVASSDVVAELVSGRAQVGLLRAQPLPAGFVTKACGRVGFALFVPRALARGATDLETLLARAPLVDVSADREPGDALAASLGRTERSTLTCETFPQAARAVATGRYSALLPTFAASEFPKGSVVVWPLPAMRIRSSRLTLVARARTLETEPAVAAFFADLAGALRERLRG